MSQGNKKNKSSAKKFSGLEQFSRKALGLDRPLTVKEKMEAKVKGDEFYLRLTKPPKGYAMSDKTHTARRQAKERVHSYKKHLKK